MLFRIAQLPPFHRLIGCPFNALHVSQQAERLLRDYKESGCGLTTTFGGRTSDFEAASGGEGEADDAGVELGIAGAVWAAADGCGFCGAGCATTPVTLGQTSCARAQRINKIVASGGD